MSINKIKNMMTKLLTGDTDELLEDMENPKKTNEKIAPQHIESTPSGSRSPSSMSVDAILKCTDLSTLLACAELDDRNKREAAVIQLGMLNDPVVISDLITRADDTVPEIRSAAKIALLKLATPENAEAFVMSLPDLLHLRKSEKENHGNFLLDIENYLVEPANVLTILSGLNDSDLEVSKLCFNLILKHELADREQFLINALKHKAVSIRLKASHLITDLDEEPKQVALKIALEDEHMPIRRDAFLSLLQSWGNESLAKTMLFDKHATIREIAVAHLLKVGEDVQYTYLRSLSRDDPQDLCAALWGLGFLKVAECVTLVKPFLEHDNAKVKEQAQVTLDTLDKVPGKFIDTVEWNSIDTQF